MMGDPAKKPVRTTPIRWLLLVLLIAAVAHGAAFLYMRSPPSPDAAEYLALGKSLATHGEFVLPTGDRAKRMPVYPWFISLLYHGQSDEKLEDEVLAAQYMLAVALSVLLAFIAWKIADTRAAVLAGVTSALYAPHLYLQTLCLSELFLVFFLTIALLCYVSWLTAQRLKWLALSGVGLALAAASLTRANAAILGLPFALDAILRSRPIGTKAIRAALLLAPLTLALTAWGLRNHQQVGKFTLSTTGGLNFYLGHNENYARDPGLAQADYAAFDRLRHESHASEVEADQLLYQRGRQFAKDHPAEEAANLLRKLRIYHESTVTSAAPSLLLLILVMLLLSPASAKPARRRRTVMQVARIALVVTAIAWIMIFWETSRPWITPTTLLPLGLIAIILMKDRLRIRPLFISLYLVEMLVAIAFIPLARLRWTVDFLLILAIAVAVSRICAWLESSPIASSPPTSPAS